MRLLKYVVLALAMGFAASPGMGAKAERKVRLSTPEISKALRGKLVSYSPAGWADAGIHEEFHGDGVWKGIYYSRGPIVFAGHWAMRNAQLCVSPNKGTIVSLWFVGERCRTVWRDRKSGRLFLEHLDPRPYGREPLPLVVKYLSTLSDVR